MTDTTTAPTPAQARLAAARTAVAELDATKATIAAQLPEPGTVVHALRGGLTVHTGGQPGTSGVVVGKGQNIVITSAMLDATKNRLGQYTGIALAADEDAQLAKYGEVRFRLGEAPDGFEPWTRGDADWSRARETARRQAWAQPTDAERAYALAEVERAFGPMATTSTILNAAPHPSIREAEVQAERIAAHAGGQ